MILNFHRLRLPVIVFSLALFCFAFAFLPTTSASAWTDNGLPICSGSDIPTLSEISSIKNVIPAFTENGSYIIVHTSNSGVHTQDMIRIYYSDNPVHIGQYAPDIGTWTNGLYMPNKSSNGGSYALSRNPSSVLYPVYNGLYMNTGVTIADADFLNPSFSVESGLCVFGSKNVVIDSNYTGDSIPGLVSSKIDIYPTMSITTDKSNNVTIFQDGYFESKYHLPNPDYTICTLENSTTHEIILADDTVGFYCHYYNLPSADYIAHMVVVYLDSAINSVYNFLDTNLTFRVNNLDFLVGPFDDIDGYPDGVYCSVINGKDWNCDISQPADLVKNVIDGTPTSSNYADCTALYPINWNSFDNFLPAIGCEIGNGLTFLFVPSPSSLNKLFSSFSTPTHGLFNVISSPIVGITSILTSTCSSIELPLPFIGGHYYLPCMTDIYVNAFGALFIMYQVIVSGVISYYLLVNFLENTKHFKNPKMDRIQVFDL